MIAGLLAIAINNSSPAQIESVVRTAYDTLAPFIADPFLLIRTGLIQSNAFAVQGLEYAGDIDRLLDEIRLQDMLENLIVDDAAGQDDVNQDEFETTEPPFSDS